jgi:hypothetical protein
MTVKPRWTSRGATRCHVAEVRGCPWSRTTGGPSPPWRTKIDASPPSTWSVLKPSNMLLVCPATESNLAAEPWRPPRASCQASMADDQFEVVVSDIYAINEQLEFLLILQRAESRKVILKLDTARLGRRVDLRQRRVRRLGRLQESSECAWHIGSVANQLGSGRVPRSVSVGGRFAAVINCWGAARCN